MINSEGLWFKRSSEVYTSEWVHLLCNLFILIFYLQSLQFFFISTNQVARFKVTLAFRVNTIFSEELILSFLKYKTVWRYKTAL